ncbi:DUF4007 family protein [Polyangium aurulentum]|uniref:DUF4007 family protein n=1 Tax=Polyangium aurulentum TaxID=2567896 RepID=UPI0010AE34DD|nr:DUF4007 family protein [Polyangium aurulentum]UQA61414.1 DUF4007 family protein [Polyangium aurulentum]
MRYSGHETFPCRHAWLPKAYRALSDNADALAEDEGAMVALGLGKNMVRSLRFWVQAMGVAEQHGRAFRVTPFADAVFGQGGYDPFLEDIRTLWLLHWKLSSHRHDPLFAWHFLLCRWQHPEVCRSEVLDAFLRESPTHSRVTLEQHLDIFLHSYLPSRGRTAASEEDGLDCPLVDLELLQPIGERRTGTSGRKEPIYAFRREPKPEITHGLFAYCLNEFWDTWHKEEQTLPFRRVAVAEGSVGQVFKLPEDDLRARLERLESVTKGRFTYRASAAQPLVTRNPTIKSSDLLKMAYNQERADV